MLEESITIDEGVGFLTSAVKIVDVNGNLGSYEVAMFGQILDELVCQRTPQIVVNLSRVRHISATAIGVMIGTANRSSIQGDAL